MIMIYTFLFWNKYKMKDLIDKKIHLEYKIMSSTILMILAPINIPMVPPTSATVMKR